MLTDYLSKKISRVSFICAVLIIVLHSQGAPVKILTPVSRYCQELLCQGLARTAVPMFFVIFAFLLFRDFEFSWSWYKAKVCRRISSLLIPYLLWALFAVLYAVALGSISSKLAFDCDWQSIEWWFGAIGLSSPPKAAYHLWFVRDCLCIVLFSPVIGLLCRLLGLWSVSIGIICSIGDPTLGEWLVWVLLGGAMAFRNEIWHLKDREIDKVGVAFMTLCYLVLHCLKACYMLHVWYLDMSLNALGIGAMWLLYDMVEGDWMKKLDSLATSSFFIYCIHPFIMDPAVRFVSCHLFSPSGVLCFVAKFLLTFMLSLIVWLVMRKHCSKFYKIVSGGR